MKKSKFTLFDYIAVFLILGTIGVGLVAIVIALIVSVIKYINAS